MRGGLIGREWSPSAASPGPAAAQPVRVQGPLLTRGGARDGMILVIEQGLRIGLVTVMGMWMAHALGPESFGLLNYVSAIVAIFYVASTLGLDNQVLARLSRDPSTAGSVLGSCVAVRFGLGLLCIPLAWALVAWAQPQDREATVLVLVAACTVPLYAPAILDAWFKQRQLALPAAFTRLGATVVSSAAKAACLLAGAGLLALAGTMVLEAVVASVLLWLVYRSYTRGQSTSPLALHPARAGELLRGCLPHALAALAIVAYLKVDVVMLGMLSTRTETGLYSLSQKLCEVLYVLPVVIVDVLYPRLARHLDLTRGHGLSDSQLYFDVAVGTAMLATLLAIALSGWLIPAVFGEPYRRSADIFQLHALSCVGIAMAHARLKWLVAAGRERTALVVTVLGLGVAVVMHAWLIPLAGAWGAAAAAVLGFTAGGYLASWLVPGLREVARLQTRACWPWGRLVREWRARQGAGR